MIAELFCEQLANSATTEVVAFVTGAPDTARERAQKFNMPNAKIYSYDTVHQMRSNPAIQVVYVATPNGLHMRDAIASARRASTCCVRSSGRTRRRECRALAAERKKANHPEAHLAFAALAQQRFGCELAHCERSADIFSNSRRFIPCSLPGVSSSPPGTTTPP